MSKFQIFLGAIAFVVFHVPVSGAAESRWNLNDVSVLFGLPRTDGADAVPLPTPRDVGTEGVLLPEQAYSMLPTLHQSGHGNSSLYERSLRVIAMRIDPCPPSDSAGCRPELRLIWQPVERDRGNQEWTTRDAALHCVHLIDAVDFERLAADLWRVKQDFAQRGIDTSGLPLGVHPAATDEETSRPFVDAMRSLILRYAGEDNLHRVTFSALRVPTRWWRFGALERDAAGQWRRVDIPRLEAQSVDIFNVAVADGVGLGAERGLDAVFNILPEEYPEQDNLFPLINKGFRFNDERDRVVFAQKLEAVARFRNPHRSNTDNLDCASCHFADAARFYALNRFPSLAAVPSSERFNNPDPGAFDLSNTTIAARSARVVRAFGFHHAEPAISQRTINESAAVAHHLNIVAPSRLIGGTSTVVQMQRTVARTDRSVPVRSVQRR